MILTHDDIDPSASAAGSIVPAAGIHPTIEVDGGPDHAVLHIRGVLRRGSVGLVRRELEKVLDRGVSTVVVDFSAVPQCDCRVLAVLDAVQRRMHAVRGRFTLSGLDPEALTGFAGASLRDLLAAYRASPGVGQPLWPGEPGGIGPTGRCTDGERLLARVCVGLVSSHDHVGGVVELGDRLTGQCVRHLGVAAAVLLLAIPERPDELSVVSASHTPAGSVVGIGLEDGHGPVAECLRTGEACSVPVLTEWSAVWPHFVEAALRHGWPAVRALPLRSTSRSRPGQPSVPRDVTGVLCLFSHAAGPMSAADLGVAQAFADLATVALAATPSFSPPA